MALLALPGEVAGECVHRDADEQDLPARRSGLQLLDEMQRSGGEVDVDPSQPEQLAFAHPGGEREDVQRFQPVTLDRVEEAPCLLWVNVTKS
jgi:hypothetical protein